MNNDRFVFPFQGLTMESLKRHTALIPLAVIMAAGMTFVGAYIIRLATKTTDVSWTKKPEPYNEYHGKQFKFLNPEGIDYSKMGTRIPNYKDEDKK